MILVGRGSGITKRLYGELRFERACVWFRPNPLPSRWGAARAILFV